MIEFKNTHKNKLLSQTTITERFHCGDISVKFVLKSSEQLTDIYISFPRRQLSPLSFKTLSAISAKEGVFRSKLSDRSRSSQIWISLDFS